MDALIFNGSTYIGDEVFSTTGVGQTCALDVVLGKTATYHVKVYNDGNMTQPIQIIGTAGNSKWAVQYVDYSTSADITASVTGAGWQTQSVKPGAYWRGRVLVTPNASVTVGAGLSLLLKGTSAVDTSKKDAVKMTTTRR